MSKFILQTRWAETVTRKDGTRFEYSSEKLARLGKRVLENQAKELGFPISLKVVEVVDG